MATATSTPPRPLKILMCHGYIQSGHIFHGKTRALEKSLQKAFPGAELVYPTGPHRLLPTDLTTFYGDRIDTADSAGSLRAAVESEEENAQSVYGWWRRRGTGEPLIYDGMQEGLERIAWTLKEQGPFDGVIGFSQGGCAAGMIASLLEPGRKAAFDAMESKGGMRWPASFSGSEASNGCRHPPMRFAVSYSGFAALPSELYVPFYEPKITTPLLHVLGSLDTVVEEVRSQRLIDASADASEKRIFRHSGGHFLPASNKECTNALILFIKEAMEGPPGSQKAEKEERVEDMDVPF